MRVQGLLILIPLVLLAAPARGQKGSASVVLDYFYEHGCAQCEEVATHILPELQDRYEGFYKLNAFDLGSASNITVLAAYQDVLEVKDNHPVMIVVDYTHALCGFREIKEKLFQLIDTSIAMRQIPGFEPPRRIITESTGSAKGIALKRLEQFTLGGILLAGLIDGLNPCAIGTLVFFMSMLSIRGVRGGKLLAMGLAFCLASYVTYTGIGLGLFRVMYSARGFIGARALVEKAMAAILAMLALLSFRDAWRYRASKSPNDVSLQLPERLKKKTHDIMRSGLGIRSILIGAAAIGVFVTLIESVCTGQVYVPVLVLLVRTGKNIKSSLPYLLLYNAMFIMPLVVVFALTFWGLQTQALIQWSKQNVVTSKVLLGLLFTAMALIMLTLP